MTLQSLQFLLRDYDIIIIQIVNEDYLPLIF